MLFNENRYLIDYIDKFSSSIFSKYLYITSNREDGQGRDDIILEPKDKINTGFVLEFKVVVDEEELEKLSAEAIEQIKKKRICKLDESKRYKQHSCSRNCISQKEDES